MTIHTDEEIQEEIDELVVEEEPKKKKGKEKVEKVEKPKKEKKTKSESLDSEFSDAFENFMRKEGKVDIEKLSEKETVPFFIDTGSYAINWIIANDMINGGYPGTKLSLLTGESGKGKSLAATVALGNNIKMGGHSINIDIEDSVNNKEFIDKIVGSKDVADKINMIGPKVDPKTGLVRPITIEKLNSILNKMLDFQASRGENKSKSLCILVDSFSALTTDKEVDDTRADKDTRDMTAQQKMRGMLRVVVQSMRHGNMTLIGIGQMTANIGVMFGPKTVESVKGTAPKYWSSLTLQLTSDKEIVDSKTGIPIGIKMRLKTTKNRIQFKGRDAWLHFYFKKGIDKTGGLPELLACYDIFKASSKKSVTNDFSPTTEFKYTTDSGKELKFKAHQFAKVVEENGGVEFIKELNRKLNAVYEDALEGVDPSEFLDTDDYEDELAEGTEEMTNLIDEISEE